jgi:HlyD family secretion protein
MRKVIALIVLIALIVPAGWIASQYMWPSPSADPSSAGPQVQANPVALGWLEPAGGVVEISGTPGEKLESLSARESEIVMKGEVLARMRSYQVRLAQVKLIESQIEEAKARLAAERKLAETQVVSAELGIGKVQMQDLDIKSLKGKIALLKMNSEQAQRDYSRLERLHGQADDLVSDQELEGQELSVRRAEAELAAAEANLEKLERTWELNKRVAQADFDAAQAGLQQIAASSTVKSLQTQLEITRAQVALTEIVAPRQGTVLKVFMEPGESVGQKPILQLADLTQMVAVAEVHENVIQKIRKGQPAIIKSRAFPPPYDVKGLEGRVERISRIISTPGLKSLDPFARADRHVVAVRILIGDKKHCEVAASFTNLQVDVEFGTTEVTNGPNLRLSHAAKP